MRALSICSEIASVDANKKAFQKWVLLGGPSEAHRSYWDERPDMEGRILNKSIIEKRICFLKLFNYRSFSVMQDMVFNWKRKNIRVTILDNILNSRFKYGFGFCHRARPLLCAPWK